MMSLVCKLYVSAVRLPVTTQPHMLCAGYSHPLKLAHTAVSTRLPAVACCAWTRTLALWESKRACNSTVYNQHKRSCLAPDQSESKEETVAEEDCTERSILNPRNWRLVCALAVFKVSYEGSA